MKKWTKLWAASLALLASPGSNVFASNTNEPSTNDLDFLLGTWSVRWTYRPGKEDERVVDGSLVCELALNDNHIFCRYRFEREDAPTIIEHVYFNYNSIYEQYEAIWVSGTWPIKVLMAGDLNKDDNTTTLESAAEFSIGNDRLEQVRSSLKFEGNHQPISRFTRTTHIRVTESASFDDVDWLHHMTEIAERVE